MRRSSESTTTTSTSTGFRSARPSSRDCTNAAPSEPRSADGDEQAVAGAERPFATLPPEAEPGDFSYLDLHTHSTDGSDDAGATVEGYLRWIAGRRRSGYRIDGIVLTEHRRFVRELDYSRLAEQYGVVVLRGVEVETDVGHVLVYGVSDRFYREFDLADVALPYRDVFRAAREHGGVAIAAHAGRPRIGAADHLGERGITLEGIEIVETLNGASSDGENARALELAAEHGLRSVGGSDAHFVSAVARCLTAFPVPILTVEALVEHLREGQPRAVAVEETHDREDIRARSRRLRASGARSSVSASEGEALSYDRSVVGVEVSTEPVEITLEQIAAYCEATGDRNPIYLDPEAARAGPYGGIIAPPGLLGTLIGGTPPNPNVKYGNMQFLAGSKFESKVPVRLGDRITGFASVREIFEKTGRTGRMVFAVNRTRYVNQHGEDVVVVETSMAHRQVAPLVERDG